MAGGKEILAFGVFAIGGLLFVVHYMYLALGVLVAFFGVSFFTSKHEKSKCFTLKTKSFRYFLMNMLNTFSFTNIHKIITIL